MVTLNDNFVNSTQASDSSDDCSYDGSDDSLNDCSDDGSDGPAWQ